jgi:hypothetical protein
MQAGLRVPSCRVRGVSWIFIAILCVLATARPTAAQWTAADAQGAFSDYNNAFYFNPGGNNYDYRLSQGSTSPTAFWISAEQIEMAIDAYNQDSTTTNQTVINQLCNGFVARYTSDWSSDSYDDDLMWATIAFTRASKATGNSAWLADAETNFATVWSRGYDTTFGGGIWWNSAFENTSSGYKNSAANWTFVIAGNLLYQATGDSTYQSEAATIFNWAFSTLYNASTGEIYDGINGSGIQAGQYSYNYGVAVGADYFENHRADANNVATYLMNNLSSGKVGGYNILPNYGQGGTDGGGFNGITLRWIGFAWVNGALSNSAILYWAQTNVGLAWATRNTAGLSWNNWQSFTPVAGLFSWDCSNTVVGMLDIPTASSGANFSLAASPSTIDLTAGSARSSTIAVTPSNAFNGTVNLTVGILGLSSGITATLSQNSISGAGQVSLNITTTSATQGGNYLVAVTGTSGNISHTAYVVIGLPFFSMSVAPASIFLNQSATASAAVTITPQNGFSGKVKLAPVSGLPPGIVAWFNPDDASTTSILTLAAGNRAITTAGAPLSIVGVSSNYTQSVQATLAVSAATGDCGGGVPVNLSAAYNETGIYPDGATYSSSGGLDGQGSSFSSNLLGNARVLSGIGFQFGPAGKPDAIYGAGQTIPLHHGQFTTLQLLATGVAGQQQAQNVIVTYTDGTTSQFTQSFSDWFSPSLNANESEADAMAYRNQSNGTQQDAQFNLYDYTFVLSRNKTVKSITLPDNRNVVILAATLTNQFLGTQVNLASAFDAIGIYTDGSTFAADGGIDGGGTAYSANLLGDVSGPSNVVVGGINFNLAAPDGNNALYGAGAAIPLPEGHFNTLRILGTGVYGSQTSQTVTVMYTDGSTSQFTQSFSDWFGPQGFPRESKAVQMAYRDIYDGTKGNGPLNLYEYTFPLNPDKTVESLTLPVNRHVVVVAAALSSDSTTAGSQTSCPPVLQTHP